MSSPRTRAACEAVLIHLARFVVIVASLWLAPALGIHGWYQGLFVNVCCVAFAAGLITVLALWHEIGIARLWAGRTALLVVAVLAGESVLRVVFGGLSSQHPGYALWALSLVLVGVNEELTSRGAVLSRLRPHFAAAPAVALTAALFGLQHLSLFVTTGRGPSDILTNVFASACYGVALAAFQYRFRWILPLIVVHAAADFTTVLTTHGLGTGFDVACSVVFVLLGLVLLRGGMRSRDAGLSALGPTKDPGRRPGSFLRDG